MTIDCVLKIVGYKNVIVELLLGLPQYISGKWKNVYGIFLKLYFKSIRNKYILVHSYEENEKVSGGRLNKKDGLTRYGDSHVKDKTS